ncbi:MAG TPA: type VI secretion protein IcmF/TssM N-terminal domain-containing protein, partial [Rhodothermales bacterium]|nr:type VI secretion protein IcmF/TssM N-terminal domain-containing protein [Rhodothermales bacterium]
ASIRRRLDELISRLGVHFPVYLVFTKSDLVEGCIEFFSDLNAREVEQIWGHTLDESEQTSKEPGQIFRSTYNRMLKTLEDLRLNRLNTNLKREDRRKVYSFPDEMTGLKDPITTFVNRLFQYNPFNENPIFRGYYFTSGTQEGTPIDRVMQALANQYSLPQTGGEMPIQRETKSYFIKDIFNHVIIPDQRMAMHTKAEKKLQNKLQIGSIALAVITMLLFFWGVGCGYSKSNQTLANLDDAILKAKSVAWSGPEKTIPNLQILDNLRLRIHEAEEESFFWTMGMTRGASAAEQARLLFFRKFRPLVEQQFYRNMESGLREYVASGQDPIGKMEEQLGAYILMGPDVNFAQGAEPPTKAEGVKHLQVFLSYAADLQFNNPSGNMRLSKEIQTMVKEQVKLFGEVVRQNEPLRFRTDQTLIRQSRELLRRNLSAKSIYHSIKRQIINQTPRLGSIGLSELLGPISSGYMFGSVRVNGFFTRSAWDTLVVREFTKRSENPVAGNWIIGPLSKAQLPSNLTNPVEYLRSLVRFYFEDYARTWVTFVQGVTYDRSGVSGSNPLSVALRLNQLSAAGSSPFQALVDSVSSQNRLSFKQEKGGNIVTNTWDSIMGNERTDIQVDQSGLDVGQSIKAIHALSTLPPPGGKGTNGGLKTLLDAYFAVSKEVERMASGQQAPMAEQSINSAKDVQKDYLGFLTPELGRE